MSNWQKTIEFFNKHQKSTRKMFIDYMSFSCNRHSYNTLDTYRNNLNSAGFLKTVDLGMYKRIKKIPNDLTVNQCLSIIRNNRKIIIKEKTRTEIVRDRLNAIV